MTLIRVLTRKRGRENWVFLAKNMGFGFARMTVIEIINYDSESATYCIKNSMKEKEAESSLTTILYIKSNY